MHKTRVWQGQLELRKERGRGRGEAEPLFCFVRYQQIVRAGLPLSDLPGPEDSTGAEASAITTSPLIASPVHPALLALPMDLGKP